MQKYISEFSGSISESDFEWALDESIVAHVLTYAEKAGFNVKKCILK